MKIAFYDDELTHNKVLQETLLMYSFQRNHNFDTLTFSSAGELLAAPFDYQILLLDIRLENGINGIDVAQQLRQKGYHGLILLITSAAEYVFQGYEIEAFRYLMKPLNTSAFCEAMDAAFVKLQSSAHTLKISFSNESFYVPVEDILYVESERRNRVIHTFTQVFRSTESLSALQQRLPQQQFALAHRSYLVNLKQVQQLGNGQITLSNLETIPLSRGNAEEFGRLLHHFIQRGVEKSC